MARMAGRTQTRACAEKAVGVACPCSKPLWERFVAKAANAVAMSAPVAECRIVVVPATANGLCG